MSKLGPHSQTEWATRLDGLVDEIEEELWFFASRTAKDRMAAQVVYLDYFFNVFRRMAELERLRLEKNFGKEPYKEPLGKERKQD